MKNTATKTTLTRMILLVLILLASICHANGASLPASSKVFRPKLARFQHDQDWIKTGRANKVRKIAACVPVKSLYIIYNMPNYHRMVK